MSEDKNEELSTVLDAYKEFLKSKEHLDWELYQQDEEE